ncbi:MAG: hypothetical protein ACR2OZ_03805 [Verrucomicrobiales bacterium]
MTTGLKVSQISAWLRWLAGSFLPVGFALGWATAVWSRMSSVQPIAIAQTRVAERPDGRPIEQVINLVRQAVVFPKPQE